MGCVHSRVEKEEVVRRCKERRRLMKRMLSLRAELAAAHMAYLQSLRNTGATLKQFTDVETMSIGNSPLVGLTLPPSPPPPPPLPPSPPPPPNFSPISAKDPAEGKLSAEEFTDDDESCPTPPPPIASSSWDFWDPFDVPPVSTLSSLAQKDRGAVLQAAAEEEDWAETKSEFGDEEEEEVEEERKVVEAKKVCTVNENVMLIPARENFPAKEPADDNSSFASCFTKDTDMAVVVWTRRKTMAGIVKELDEYFLRAAAGGKDLAALLASNRGRRPPWEMEARKGKSTKSAKVVNAFSWSWSFRSPHSNRDAQDPTDAVMPGNHCTTLEKLYAEEQKLYKEVKDEEIAKVQYKKIMLILHKLEARDHDWMQTEKTRSNVEELQSRLISLQESITEKCSSISKLRDEELYPQLIEFSVGLVQMWRTMYECHQVQSHVSQQVNLLDNHPGADPTTDSHRHATAQLETEVASWYNSFCNLFKCQREYVHILGQWVRLTNCLPESNGLINPKSGICGLCQQLQSALDNLPDKAAAEAINSFLLVIRSIVLQQSEERGLQKRSDRLEIRLEKELKSLNESEKRNETTIHHSTELLTPTKHAKLEAFRRRVEEEKARYLNSVRVSRAMTLNNLQTSLPNIFQALMGFASVCVQAFEGITSSTEAVMNSPEVASLAH